MRFDDEQRCDRCGASGVPLADDEGFGYCPTCVTLTRAEEHARSDAAREIVRAAVAGALEAGVAASVIDQAVRGALDEHSRRREMV